MRSLSVVPVMCLLCGASASLAGTGNLLHNPSFEIVNPANSLEPEGWHNLSGSGLRREIGDMGGEILVRTGNASIEVPTMGFGGFDGFTTNVLNPNTLETWDPPFVLGPEEPDAVFSGYFAIPASQPIDGDAVGFKVEFRRDDSSIFATYEELPLDEFANLGNGSGVHTNGEWVYFELTVTQAELQVIADEFPPGPTSVSVLPFRFAPDLTTTTGTVFFDDLDYRQEEVVPNCPGDASGDNNVDIVDLNLVLGNFGSMGPAGDLNDDNSVDIQDLNLVLGNFGNSCN